MSEHHNIIIIGGGLSGLYTAWQLQQSNHDVIVLEARQQSGGRILSHTHRNSRYDMGPAWVWPQLQPRLQNLLTQLDMAVFNQFTTGDMLYEKSPTDIDRHSGQSSHQQSYRINNASLSLIEQLQSTLQAGRIHLNTEVKSIDTSELTIQTLRSGKQYTYSADKIILALPPRLFMQNISFTAEFSNEIKHALENIPTWMSGQCKILFVYSSAFWREQGLSGEVFSHHGPLSEIYDASPADENFFALTAFIGLNAQQRKQIEPQALLNSCIAQLQRLFGEQARNTVDIQIKDWALDTYTTSELDLSTPAQHPHYAENLPRSFFNNNLILAGTEVAREHGGYLEGALESADEAIGLLNQP